jgi:hypothetical protein
MDRVVIVKKDGVEIARYTIGFSWGDAASGGPDYFKIASRNAVKDGHVTREEVGKLSFEFAT